MSLSEQLDALLEAPGGRMAQGGSFSLTLGKVTNIKDDKNLNRVKCLPIGAKDPEETDWCYVMSPMGGKDRGLFLFPQVGDLVVLGYLDGDPHRPIVLGCFWNTETTPPLAVKDGKAEEYCLRTPQKIEMLLHDEKGKEKLTVTMPSGTVLVLDDDAKKVTLKDKGGDNALLMDLQKGEIELKAKSKLTLSAGQTKITLEQGGNITEKGNGTITLDGASIKGKAKGSLSLQGMDGEMKANASLKLSASGPASLKGAILKLN
ncbi:MAG: hypothetical protein IJU66_04665 [Oscillospiraceae bacterium]|nr:hypothetical protein [Oscillospiraceae bacterium]